MISVLLPALALMVLLALIKGRSTGTKLLGFSWLSRKICVRIWSPRACGWPICTVPACSLASASGTTFSRPAFSTTVKPRPRSAARYWRQASAGGTALSLVRLIWPRTRGSTRICRSSMVPMARETISISALAKFSVTGARARVAGRGMSSAACSAGLTSGSARLNATARATADGEKREMEVMITRSKVPRQRRCAAR